MNWSISSSVRPKLVGKKLEGIFGKAVLEDRRTDVRPSQPQCVGGAVFKEVALALMDRRLLQMARVTSEVVLPVAIAGLRNGISASARAAGSGEASRGRQSMESM